MPQPLGVNDRLSVSVNVLVMESKILEFDSTEILCAFTGYIGGEG